MWALILLWFYWRILERLRLSGFSVRVNNSEELSPAVVSPVFWWSSLLLSQLQPPHHKNIHKSVHYMFQLTRPRHWQSTDRMGPLEYVMHGHTSLLDNDFIRFITTVSLVGDVPAHNWRVWFTRFDVPYAENGREHAQTLITLLWICRCKLQSNYQPKIYCRVRIIQSPIWSQIQNPTITQTHTNTHTYTPWGDFNQTR